MIDIGYKTLLIIGGVNFDQESVGDGCIYDYGSDPFGYICLSRRRDLGLSLPCGECRTHHTSILCLDKKEGRKKSTKVLVMGGGAICLGFGAHFCVSLSIDVNFLFQSKKEIITSKQEKSHVVSEKNDVEMIKQVLNSTNRLLTVRGICVPKEKVKGLKIYLEQNNFLERSVRITVYTDSPLESLALEGFSECTVSPPSISTANLMVVPITSTFEQLLAVSNSTDISIALNRLLDTANVLFTTHLCPRTKSECLSRYSLVTSYIELFCKKYPQYAGSLNSRGGIIPLNGGKLKLETVGDVLMIPEDVLCISPWNEFVLEQQHGQQQDSKNNVPLLLLQDLWLGLATCFGVSRVARKAKIDSGPKRESRVRLLLPAVGISPKTGLSLTLYQSISHCSLLSISLDLSVSHFFLSSLYSVCYITLSDLMHSLIFISCTRSFSSISSLSFSKVLVLLDGQLSSRMISHSVSTSHVLCSAQVTAQSECAWQRLLRKMNV